MDQICQSARLDKLNKDWDCNSGKNGIEIKTFKSSHDGDYSKMNAAATPNIDKIMLRIFTPSDSELFKDNVISSV